MHLQAEKTMDSIDKKILNIIQKDFPVVAKPFKTVAQELDLSEDEVLTRIARMKEEGIIRRIGAVFDTRRLGFVSTLCAAKVPADKLKDFVNIVNSYPGVTHNYRRKHVYNVWFTFIASDQEKLNQCLTEISETTGVADIVSMNASRIFKIDATFEL